MSAVAQIALVLAALLCSRNTLKLPPAGSQSMIRSAGMLVKNTRPRRSHAGPSRNATDVSPSTSAAAK